MRLSPSLIILLLFAALASTPLRAQEQPKMPTAVPLSLDGDPQPTHAPPVPLNDAQCDGSGNVYLRYDNSSDGTTHVVKFASDGAAEEFPLAMIPGHPPEAHVYTFSVGDDGSLHEAVQTWDSNGPDPDLRIYYVRFDQDGSVRSAAPFDENFTPFVLLPFSDGKFFAAGAVVKKSPGGDGIEESPAAGIFDYNAALVRELRRGPQQKSASDVLPDDTALQSDLVRLGSDGNIYVLLSSDKLQLKVFGSSGVLVREVKLRQPFEDGLPSRLLVSGDRALVVYEGEADDPKDSFLYVLYDIRTGEVIRVYHPEFSGTPVCMQDGQSVTVLLPQKYSGVLSLGTALLQ